MAGRVQPGQDPRELPIVKEALASIEHGGHAEAAARVAFLLARKGEPLPLSRLELRKDLLVDYKDLLPSMTIDEARRVRGEQEVIVRYEPEQAIETLPLLLPEQADRERFVALLDQLMTDQRVRNIEPLPEQVAMLERIHQTLEAGNEPHAKPRRNAGRSQRAAR